MSLYGLYLRNPSTDLIFLLQMDGKNIYWSCATEFDFRFFFSWKLKYLQKLKTCDM